jgi:hypothetical protein
MTERLAESNHSVRELQGELVSAQRRLARSEREAADAVARAKEAERAVARAGSRIGELVQSIELLRAERAAEEADALASWEADGGEPARGSVEELVTWEEKAAEIQAEQDEIARAVKRA